MSINAALEKHLLSAAAKALGTDLERLIPKTTLKKVSPEKPYADYDMTLGQFYVPGKTRREDPTEEHKLLAGLKVMAEKLKKENDALKNLVRSEAEKAAKKGFEKGLRDGFEQGYQKGKQEASKEVAAVRADTVKVLEKFEIDKKVFFHEAEGKVIELALLATEAIIGKTTNASDEAVLNVVKKGIAEIASSDTVTLRINPLNLEAVESGKNFWHSVSSNLKDVKIVADTRVDKGGCIVESAGGAVDARLETQLKSLRTSFLKLWQEASGF